jgi:hypothetical protein
VLAVKAWLLSKSQVSDLSLKLFSVILGRFGLIYDQSALSFLLLSYCHLCLLLSQFRKELFTLTSRRNIFLGVATFALAVTVPGIAHASTSILNFEITQTTVPFQLTLDSSVPTLASVGDVAVKTTFEGPTDGSVADGSTADTSLSFPAITQSAPGVLFGGLDFVPFTNGSFTFGDPGNLLLSGTFQNALFDFAPGGTAASFDSNTVTYTGGSDLAAYEAATGANVPTGNFTLSFSGLSPALSLDSSENLQPFTASTAGTTGTFDINPNIQPPSVPEANTFSLLALGGLGLMGLTLRGRRARSSA